MIAKNNHYRQTGSSLLVSLIMLIAITFLALSAIKASNINLRISGNVQYQDEARSAAQQAIEQFISNPANFTSPSTTSTPINIDVNNDSAIDYTVIVAAPRCRRAAVQQPARSTQCASGVKSGLYCWDTLWDIKATASNAITGVSQVITQGVAMSFSPSFQPSSVGC